MLKFHWNALRRDDRVLLHDPTNAEMALIPGVVAMIEAHVVRKGANRIGIRVADDVTGDHNATSTILWPPYLTVHLDPVDATEPCWRCEEIAARAPAVVR